jgi:hypothetical protein
MRVRNLMGALLSGVMLLTVAARPAAGQQAGDVGVTMGYPGAIGVVWHVTERFAVRPDVTLTRNTSESRTTSSLFQGQDLSSTTTSEGWASAVGLSALVTVRTIERLRLYLSPRVAYSHSTSENESGLTGALSAFTATTRGVIASGSFGTQYNVHDRFALFGELGLQYTTLTTKSDFPGSSNETDSTSFGLRSAVGVTFYF